MQKLSTFVEQGKTPGTFVNSLTKETIADTTFVPVLFSKYWNLLKLEGDKLVFEARVVDKDDPRLKGRVFFNDGPKKANVNSVLSFVALMGGAPVVVPFTKTSYKNGKKLLTLATLSQKDLFATKYKLVAVKENSAHGTYFVADVEQVGPSDAAEYARGEALWASLSGKFGRINANAGLEGEGAGEDVPF